MGKNKVNENDKKVIRMPVVERPDITPLMALKEIENEVMAGNVENLIVVVHRKSGDGDTLRWVASKSDWTTKAAMASFLFYTVNKE